LVNLVKRNITLNICIVIVMIDNYSNLIGIEETLL
jgi:hypothetical protein